MKGDEGDAHHVRAQRPDSRAGQNPSGGIWPKGKGLCTASAPTHQAPPAAAATARTPGGPRRRGAPGTRCLGQKRYRVQHLCGTPTLCMGWAGGSQWAVSPVAAGTARELLIRPGELIVVDAVAHAVPVAVTVSRRRPVRHRTLAFALASSKRGHNPGRSRAPARLCGWAHRLAAGEPAAPGGPFGHGRAWALPGMAMGPAGPIMGPIVCPLSGEVATSTQNQRAISLVTEHCTLRLPLSGRRAPAGPLCCASSTPCGKPVGRRLSRSRKRDPAGGSALVHHSRACVACKVRVTRRAAWHRCCGIIYVYTAVPR